MASLLDIQSKVVGTCMPLLVLLVQRAPDLLLVQRSHVAHFVHDTALSEYPHVSVQCNMFLNLLPVLPGRQPYQPLQMLYPSPPLPIGGSSAFHDLFLSHCVFLRLAIFPPYAAAVSPMFLLSALSICRNDSSIPGWVKWEEDISKNRIVVVE
ncbi:hypothetical protein EDC04DRAFT_2601066 [Pisolithus marmoratus]|nr:hypothetical protein EDC04DRAFT_2606502 [Pisolithus marmoratus]KAI6042280.1 hypothetical protein EDC04DRAFT_2601066 [Pisolithus marmoratus]